VALEPNVPGFSVNSFQTVVRGQEVQVQVLVLLVVMGLILDTTQIPQ